MAFGISRVECLRFRRRLDLGLEISGSIFCHSASIKWLGCLALLCSAITAKLVRGDPVCQFSDMLLHPGQGIAGKEHQGGDGAVADHRRIRVFVASPGDVAPERARLATVIDELNRSLCTRFGITLELMCWETHVAPYMGRPQQVVFDQLPLESWDAFVGILWMRFGTRPGAIDSITGREFLSGTEEEFALAYRSWRATGRPKILFYRCVRPPTSVKEIDIEQLKRVQVFFDDFSADGLHPGLVQEYGKAEEFERLVREHLVDVLLNCVFEGEPPILGPEISLPGELPRIPDNLPRREPFFGRKREIKKALQALHPEDRGWGLLIDGIGGIGKTALAKEVAYLCKEQGRFEGFVFVTAKPERLTAGGIKSQGFAMTTLDSMLNEVARVLGQSGVSTLPGGQPKQQALLDVLRDHRALLIFDNLETLSPAEQDAVIDFLRRLPIGNKAIITSRRRPGESAVTLRLEKMPWEDARKIMEDFAERSAEVRREMHRAGELGQKELYDEAGGSPLAISWTLGLIYTRGMSFERALGTLREGGCESDLNAFIYREALKTMDGNERAVLYAMSLFGKEASFDVLRASSGLSRRALESALERLLALSLVSRETVSAEYVRLGVDIEERYGIHPLTRRFARADLAGDIETERAIGMRFAEYWLDYTRRYGGEGRGTYSTYINLEQEWDNLEAAARWLKDASGVGSNNVDLETAEMLTELVDALRTYVWFWGRWDEHVELSKWAHDGAWALNDNRNLCLTAYDIAFVSICRGDLETALGWTQKHIEIAEDSGNPLQRAIGKRLLGLIREHEGELDGAEELYREALNVCNSLNSDEDTAIILGDLGQVMRKKGKLDQARDLYDEAFRLDSRLGDRDGMATDSRNLGSLFLELEQFAEARFWFDRALSLAGEIGRLDLLAHAQVGKARAILRAGGQVEEARELVQQARVICRRLQLPNISDVDNLLRQIEHASRQ